MPEQIDRAMKNADALLTILASEEVAIADAHAGLEEARHAFEVVRERVRVLRAATDVLANRDGEE